MNEFIRMDGGYYAELESQIREGDQGRIEAEAILAAYRASYPR